MDTAYIYFINFDRSSLAPINDGDCFATEWLERYFDVTGDKDPVSKEIRMSLNYKCEIYDEYQEAFKSVAGEGLVSRER